LHVLPLPARLGSLGEPGVNMADRMAHGRNPDWDIDQEIGSNGELFVADIVASLKDGQSIEVKTDVWAPKSGNVYVEYSCRYFGKYEKSGISVTTARLWAFVLASEVAVFTPVDRLKILARYYYRLGRTRNGGMAGSHPTWGVLIPVDRLIGGLMSPPVIPALQHELNAG
jgi:hypothetical protein